SETTVRSMPRASATSFWKRTLFTTHGLSSGCTSDCTLTRFGASWASEGPPARVTTATTATAVAVSVRRSRARASFIGLLPLLLDVSWHSAIGRDGDAVERDGSILDEHAKSRDALAGVV